MSQLDETCCVVTIVVRCGVVGEVQRSPVVRVHIGIVEKFVDTNVDRSLRVRREGGEGRHAEGED